MVHKIYENSVTKLKILSCVGRVTRQINSRRLRIQRFIERSLLHTQVQLSSLNSITWLLSLIRSLHFGGYFQTSLSLRRLMQDCLLRMYCLLLCLWSLLLNEPFVVTVETPVRITIELLLLHMQRAVLEFPWKYLFWIQNTLHYLLINNNEIDQLLCRWL
jgi:hypothetical protein